MNSKPVGSTLDDLKDAVLEAASWQAFHRKRGDSDSYVVAAKRTEAAVLAYEAALEAQKEQSPQ